MYVPLTLWNQFGANPAGSGYRLVDTTAAAAPGWAADLPGPTGTSSPVLGPDGTIYIGTSNCWLVALYPDYQRAGQIKWSTQLLANVRPDYTFYDVHTPAVADDGTIYSLCTNKAVVRQHEDRPPQVPPSFLVKTSADGVVQWAIPVHSKTDFWGAVNGVVNGAPRLVAVQDAVAVTGLGEQGGSLRAAERHHGGLAPPPPAPGPTRILFVVRYTLSVNYPELGTDAFGPEYVTDLVIADDSGRYGFTALNYEDYKLFVDVHGGGGFDLGNAVLTITGPSDLSPYTVPCADTPIVFAASEWWTIIAPGRQGLYLLGWEPRTHEMTQGPTQFPMQSQPFPGPVAFANDVVAALAESAVTFIDPETLTQSLGAASLSSSATVAGGGRQMYFVDRFGTVTALEPNGDVWKRRRLNQGSVAFPAVSGNHVHVATTAGLHTLTLDLEEVAFFPLTGAGLSSPAIGPDGALYVAAGPFMYAFSDNLPSPGGGFHNL
jgi:outer membrane protein assembly factor BamB